jgi:group II intron reverse transcriptase/maturase
MSIQMELPLGDGGGASRIVGSDEARAAANGTGCSGSDHLIDQVVERSNLQRALRRVKRNKGSPGVDGMTVDELPEYLRTWWPAIRAQLLDGSYRPKPVLRVEIPKSDGGTRMLGIPCVLDRFIQQSILQVLQPRFDPTFSEHSYGFRPGRSAHDAVCAAQRYIQAGHRFVVDVDLEQFFDRVNHDVLMSRLARRVADRGMLGLIRRYLEAGIMADGLVTARHEGTPQGGPLSPLLSNVLLDEVDKELEKRGHAFARYADDCNVYVRSWKSGRRVMQTLRRLYARLRLRVNEAKSALANPRDRKFLGYSFWYAAGGSVKPRVAAKPLAKLKQRVREMTSRVRGRSMKSIATELRTYLRGWKNYFRLAETPSVFRNIDKWIRHRLRAVQLKQWRHGKTVYRELVRRGVIRPVALTTARYAKRCWALAASKAISIALPARYFDELGVPRLAD